MKANPRANTKPETALRSELHRRGLRFRKDLLVRTPAGVRTKVDIAFTRSRIAVFLDGCFWHGCPEHRTTPKANADYWIPKLARNQERDARVTSALQADGWTVIRAWEHEAAPEVAAKVAAAVLGRPLMGPDRPVNAEQLAIAGQS